MSVCLCACIYVSLHVCVQVLSPDLSWWNKSGAYYKSVCLCVGLSPDLQSMEQIRRIMRPTDVPDQGLLCDLLWSDPDKETMGWGENDRGVSFTFGAEVVAKFLHKHDLDLICRAHQVSFCLVSLLSCLCVGKCAHCLSQCLRSNSRWINIAIVTADDGMVGVW